MKRLMPISTPTVRKRVTAIVLVWLGVPAVLLTQSVPEFGQAAAESVTVVAGSHYRAGWLHAVLAGRGYRELWTESLAVEVADLERLGNGLTPLRVGDDATTKTLHLVGANGRQYVLRSVDKFVGPGLDEAERGTLNETVLQDQISAYHPTGALVLAPLLEAVGVLHVEPRLMVVPNHPRLGPFRDEFAGSLVFFEEFPQDGTDGGAGFAGAIEIVDTETLFELLDQDSRHRVDAQGFLRARLVDLIVGDRDRKHGNWLWARFDGGQLDTWRPISRNHDQAFIRVDGFLRGKLRLYNPRLVAFGEDYSSIDGLTRSARDMDRPFLVGIDKPTWDSLVSDVQRRLTDSVIDAAVQRLPPEHHRLVGANLARTLKRRRDRLRHASDRLYKIVSSYADVHASDQPDLAVVDRIADDQVEIRLSSRAQGPAGTPYFRRTFNRRETREIRLYLLGGQDQAEFRGTSKSGIKVRIVGGDGADELISSAEVRQPRSYFYDAGDRPDIPDWGRTWRPAPIVRFNPDHGAVIGAGVVWRGHGFRREPYKHRLLLRAGVSTSKRFLFEYQSDFTDVTPGVSGTLHAFLSGVDRVRFHGFGNETNRLQGSNFHRVTQYRSLVESKLTVSPFSRTTFSFGPLLKITKTRAEPGRIVQDTLYGAGLFSQVGAQAAIRWTTRGLSLNGGARIYPALLEVAEIFGKLHGEMRAYVSVPVRTAPTFAVRIGGTKVWGRIPFHEAAYLGGGSSLRGFELQRFAGDAAVYGSADTRLTLARFFTLFPTELGVLGLADVGRVYFQGTSPGGWHPDAGGGIWIAPLRREYTLSFTVVRGTEQTAFYLRTGFLF